MPGRRTGIVLLVALATAGCGSGGSGQKSGLTAAQSQALVAQLESVRAGAASHDVASAKAALRRFTASVARLRRSGALTDDSAHTMRVAAARILKRVQSDNPPPATPAQPAPPSTTSSPTPAPAPPPAPKQPAHAKPPKHKEEKAHGKGHGNEGGD